MKKAKLNKIKKVEEKELEKDTYSLKTLLKIILIIVVILGIFYFITTLLVKPVDNNNDNSIIEIDSTKITLNNLLNRKEDTYYVLATKSSLYDKVNSKINYIELYNNYINKYISIEGSNKFYTIDLDDALNKKYLSDELNISNEISEIKLNDEVLFKVKDKKIDKYFVGNKDILEELSKIQEKKVN